MNQLLAQFVNLLGALLLMLAFAMISQRRVLSLVHLFTLQGVVLVLATATVGYATDQPHLFVSAALTLLLKVILIPILLHRLIDRLNVRWDVETLAHRELAIYPALAFAGVAFIMVSLAENARVPVDNPATHLELTMIHEALILEYSGRHLALIEWAASLKLFAYSCIGLALFFPWGVAEAHAPLALLLALPVLLAKLAIGGVGMAVLETLAAKMRIFRVPEFLAGAFLLAVIGLLVHLLLAGASGTA